MNWVLIFFFNIYAIAAAAAAMAVSVTDYVSTSTKQSHWLVSIFSGIIVCIIVSMLVFKVNFSKALSFGV